MRKSIITMIIIITLTNIHLGQNDDHIKRQQQQREAFVFWNGLQSKMTIHEFASYCAPVFWFSSDEPGLGRAKGKDIKIPEPFPFEEPSDSPVVYYQLREILQKENVTGPSFIEDTVNFNNSIIDLEKIGAATIDYSHYYRFEAGLGGHDHDTEQAQFKIFIRRRAQPNDELHYEFILLEVNAKAHALEWYDNIYKIDTLNTEIQLPFHILVEEGKHASCTDINADGYYTPGYDVNVRVNDAWGLRDVIRTGDLFSAEFKGFMAKVRRQGYRVFPPLPDDSPHKKNYTVDNEYVPENAVYELRPMPPADAALPDIALQKDMSGYSVDNWPHINEETGADKFFEWWETGQFINSLAVAFRYNNDDIGISFAFPLLIVKNVEAPLIGGWLVNRIYLQDTGLRDFGYTLLYTPSASRFLDPYFALGVEIDKFDVPGTEEVDSKTYFIFETGIKIRGNVKYSPLKFLGALTDFWGLRIGIKNRGFPNINEFTYLFEIGAGVW